MKVGVSPGRAVALALVLTIASAGCGREGTGEESSSTDSRPAVAGASKSADALPSWNEGAAKSAILAFVRRVTAEGSSSFVPPAARIATFDNDGTLWTEQPIAQLAFVVDRVEELAPAHPEWKQKQPFEGVLEGDVDSVEASGERGIFELFVATHTGMTTEEFERIQTKWIAEAKHPRFQRPYTDLVYQPMLELLRYLRANGFKTYIVSGGGVEFMRPWSERVYGVPPEQVIGSSGKLKYELRNGAPVLVRLPEAEFIDDKAGKPVAIQKFIGRRPIMAVGNSDGDLQMLEWTTSGKGPRFGMLVHHTDAVREFAYDRQPSVSRLSTALDLAPSRGWVVVDMKRDWRVVYPFQGDE